MTLRSTLEAIYGRLLTHYGPVHYSAMHDAERHTLIAQHVAELDLDLKALELEVNAAYRDGIATAVSAFRGAEGLDVDAIDDIVAALYDPSL